MYASVLEAIIGSNSGLSCSHRHAIIQTNADLSNIFGSFSALFPLFCYIHYLNKLIVVSIIAQRVEVK